MLQQFDELNRDIRININGEEMTGPSMHLVRSSHEPQEK